MYTLFQAEGGKKALKCQLVSYFTLFSQLRPGTSLMHLRINQVGAMEPPQRWSGLSQARQLPAPLYLHCCMGWDWDSAWTWAQPSPHSCHPGLPYNFPAQKAVNILFFSYLHPFSASSMLLAHPACVVTGKESCPGSQSPDHVGFYRTNSKYKVSLFKNCKNQVVAIPMIEADAIGE